MDNLQSIVTSWYDAQCACVTWLTHSGIFFHSALYIKRFKVQWCLIKIFYAFNKTVIDFWYRLTSWFINPGDFTFTLADGLGKYKISRVDKKSCQLISRVNNCILWMFLVKFIIIDLLCLLLEELDRTMTRIILSFWCGGKFDEMSVHNYVYY